MLEQILIRNPMRLSIIRTHPNKPNNDIVVLCLLLMPMLLHQILGTLFLHRFWYSLVFVCVYAFGANDTALVIASLFEAYLYCQDLLFFYIASYNNSIKGYVPCWLGFQLWVIHCSIVFVSWLEVCWNCFALCWFGFKLALVMNYN